MTKPVDPNSGEFGLLDELAEEFAARYRKGERPSLQSYCDRYPQLADEIRELFPALVGLELAEEAREERVSEAVPLAAPRLKQIGDYSILREVGRGGMGVVFEAEQVSLGRRVALKILPDQIARDPKVLERFRREARSAARLHHTNIVPVFEVGQDGDVVYYAMQFIQGQGLDAVTQELRKLQERTRAKQRGRDSHERVHPAVDAAAHTSDLATLTHEIGPVAVSLLTGRFDAAAEGIPDGDDTADWAGAVTSALSSSAIEGLRDRTHQVAGSQHSEMAAGGPISGGSSAVLPGGTAVSSLETTSANRRKQFYRGVGRIGQQAAQGLGYAHARGVIHRDIKPSNMLLDTAGVVWITDFGLAKADDDGLTATGDILGTLRYMAPERFRGEGDERADVYALGLTLYELLTYRPAFDTPDRLRLIERIKNEEPTAPRSLDPHIPRDLETIVLKAIDKDPKRRYQTADEMAEDIRCFLEDEPIAARRETLVERTARWARRNPWLATLEGVLAAVLVLALSASLIVNGRMARLAQDREQAAALASHAAQRARISASEARVAEKKAEERRTEAVAALEVATTQRKLAESSMEDAKNQAHRAEESFQKAMATVDQYFTQVSESQLLSVPGLQPLRADMLTSALLFYEDFLKNRGQDASVRSALAEVQLKIGRIHSELGQEEQASKAFQNAQALYESLSRMAPENSLALAGLAECQLRLASNETDARLRRQRLLKSVTIREGLVANAPADLRMREDLARSYQAIGEFEFGANQQQAGLSWYLKARDIAATLVRDQPDNAGYQHNLGRNLGKIALCLCALGLHKDETILRPLAIEHAKTAYELEPHMVEYGDHYAELLAKQGDNLGASNSDDESRRSFQDAFAVQFKLVRDNPAVPGLQEDLVGMCQKASDTLRQKPEGASTVAVFDDLMEAMGKLPQEDPRLLFMRARILAIRADWESAWPSLRQKSVVDAELAIEDLQRAVDAGFQNGAAIKSSPSLSALRGREAVKSLIAKLEQSPKEQPATTAETARTTATRPLRKHAAPGDLQRYQSDLAVSQHAVALVQLGLGDKVEAVKSMREVIELREALCRANVNDLEAKSVLSDTHFTLASILFDLNQPEEAMKSLTHAVLIPKALVELEPNNVAYRVRLLDRLASVARLHKQAGRIRSAVKAWSDARYSWAAQVTNPATERTQLGDTTVKLGTEVGANFGQLGLWKEAAEIYEDLSVLPMSESTRVCTLLFNAALLRLRDSDIQNYRHLCEKMRAEHGSSVDPAILKCVLLANALSEQSGADAKWFEAARDRFQKQSNLEPEQNNAYIVALSLYREGRFDEALKSAQENAGTESSQIEQISSLPLLALIQNRLGQAYEAGRTLSKIEQWSAENRLSLADSEWASILPVSLAPGDDLQRLERWTAIEVLSIEASRAIRGTPTLLSAEDHINRGFVYAKLGASERSAAEFRLAVLEAPEDVGTWLSRGLAHAHLGNESGWASDFSKALSFPKESHSESWIRAGRVWAERGNDANAQIAYKHAAAGPGDPLKPFLKAGWWVRGVSKETAKQPFEASHFDPAEAHESSDRPRWSTKHADATNRLRLNEFASESSVFTDAVTFIEAKVPRAATLRVSTILYTEIWLNDRRILIHGSGQPTETVPLFLRAGRNVLHARSASERASASWLAIDFDDSLFYRGMSELDALLWKDALGDLSHSVKQVEAESNANIWTPYLRALLVNGKIAEYKHEYERMLKRFGHMAAADADIGVFASCYMPPDASAAYAAWTVTAEKWLAAAPRSAEHLIWAGNAHYRAAQFQKAEEFLRQAYERDSSYAVVWPLLASSLAQQGKLDEARGWLVRAQEYEPYFLSALLSNLPLRPGMNENEWPSFRIFKREAETLIEGSARTTHPLQTKFESRNRSILETADPLGREFALFELQNRHDISHRLAWARELATEGRWDDAEQEVDRRASIEPENSRLWIDWGHILVQLGRNENADRAYARAAAQYPSELSRFFEAGLWSVGPIKRASAFAQSIRQHTETTARVTSGDPPTERWNLVAPDRQGFVPLPPGQSHADESVFVLGHVFSPDSRSATLLVGGQGTPTFWLNGRRVVTEFNSGGEYFRSVDRVPLMLERGRNVLLVELQASSRLRFRLADNPGDQAADLASLGQIEEASTQFKKHFARGFDPEWDIWLHFGHLLRLQQDCAGFDLLVNQVMAHYGYAPQNPVLAYFMAVSLTSRPGELNADAIKALLNLASTDQQNNWNLPWTAWAAVRSGEVGQAARATKVFAQRPDDYPWIIPVWAMVEDAQGHSAEARYWLEKAHRWGNGLAERIGAESRLRVPMQWYDVARFGIAMSQARKAILGEEVAAIDDPIAKSLSQRGLKELKSLDHQARDFELAELLQPDNPRFRVGYARWLLGAGRFDLAEAYLARRAKQHHDPAGLWIDWGRSLAEQGRSREADAAYARAAVLAPDEPSRFLAAGWWVAGPYSELLSAHYPPEADPDPSRPLMGENGVLLDWKSLAVSALFECDLKPTSVRELASAYTLAHVYQLRERTSLLCMGIDDKARVWLNGQLIFDSDSGLNSFQGSLDWCVPVTLRAGRNTLLMKVSNTGGGHSIRVRFDDCGVETINLQAQFARWDDAVRTYERMERVGAALSSWQLTPIALLMAGRVDRSGYENIVARYSGFTATDARNDAIMFGLRENGKIDYNRLVDRARAALPKVIPPNEPWHTAGLMLALYRAGRYQETLDLIHKHCPEGGQTWEACIQAMAHHRLGEHDQATAWLSKADALYEQLRQSILGGKTLSLGENWGATAAAFAALRHEAHELVEGKPFDFSADLREMESKIGHFLDDRASPTWAFDVAVTMNPNTAGYELARAERLLELGRLNEGELALAKAAELKPDDPNVWQKRARIFEQRGDLDRAAGAYALMLDKLPQDLALYNNRGHTLDEILANEQVFKRLLELRPADPLLWYVRAARHIGRKEWSQALADYRQGGEPPVYTEHAYLYGASLIMVGDRAGYRDYVRKIAAAVSGVDDPWQNYIFSRTASLVDDNGVEVELVLRAGEKASAANLAWYTHSLAGALLRAGDPSRAVALLDDPRATEWQRHVTALLKSMAHAQLGHTEEARELLAISRKELPPQAAIHPGVPNSTLMTDWVELEVLGPEASAQILDPAFPADPFAR